MPHASNLDREVVHNPVLIALVLTLFLSRLQSRTRTRIDSVGSLPEAGTFPTLNTQLWSVVFVAAPHHEASQCQPCGRTSPHAGPASSPQHAEPTAPAVSVAMSLLGYLLSWQLDPAAIIAIQPNQRTPDSPVPKYTISLKPFLHPGLCSPALNPKPLNPKP